MDKTTAQLYHFLLVVGDEINKLDAENVEILDIYGVLEGLSKAAEYTVMSSVDS